MALINKIREYAWQRRKRDNNITLNRAPHMPIVPTKFGLFFGFLLLVMFIWSVNHQLNLGYILIFLNGIIAVFSAATTVNILAKLHITIGDATPVFAGEKAYIPIHIQENSGRHRAAFIIANREHETTCQGIEANQHTTMILTQNTQKRGWHPTQPLEIRTSLPLHCFVTWQWINPQHQHLVYPAPIGEQPLPQQNTTGHGEQQITGIGDDELSHLSAYQNGDPLSRVAWKQLSRGEMMSKRFSGEGTTRIILDYAQTKGDHETRLSQLSKWIIEAEALGADYQLKLPNYESPLSHGSHHYHHCLQTLAEQP